MTTTNTPFAFLTAAADTRTVAELHRDAADAVAFLKTAGQRAVALRRDALAQERQIAARWDLEEAAKARGVAEVRARHAEATFTLKLHAKVAERRIDEYVERATAAQHEGGDAALESQRTAAWARMRSQLDALEQTAARSMAAAKMLAEAAKVGDRATLEAARRELPAYLRSQNEDMPHQLTVELDLIAGPQIARDARAFQLEHADGIANTLSAVGSIERAANPGQSLADVPVVPAWDGSPVIIDEVTA